MTPVSADFASGAVPKRDDETGGPSGEDIQRTAEGDGSSPMSVDVKASPNKTSEEARTKEPSERVSSPVKPKEDVSRDLGYLFSVSRLDLHGAVQNKLTSLSGGLSSMISKQPIYAHDIN